MGWQSNEIIVITSPTNPELAPGEVVTAARAYGLDSDSGDTDLDYLEGDNPALGLHLDSRLATTAILDLLAPGSSKMLILVEDGPDSEAAREVRAAVDHLRAQHDTWLQVVYRQREGLWIVRSP